MEAFTTWARMQRKKMAFYPFQAMCLYFFLCFYFRVNILSASGVNIVTCTLGTDHCISWKSYSSFFSAPAHRKQHLVLDYSAAVWWNQISFFQVSWFSFWCPFGSPASSKVTEPNGLSKAGCSHWVFSEADTSIRAENSWADHSIIRTCDLTPPVYRPLTKERTQHASNKYSTCQNQNEIKYLDLHWRLPESNI